VYPFEPVSYRAVKIVELRRYGLRPRARDTLIELFDRELVETQEAVGMRVLGQFRDLDDPDSFVWLRGFADMGSRRRALERFYSGPVWKEHARAANATMLDVDNVLLLRPLSGRELATDGRAPPGSSDSPPGLVVVTIFTPAEPSAFPELFAREVEPMLREAGVPVLATLVTEHSPNDYPALPVREDADVFVWLSLFADEADHESRAAELERVTAGLAPHLDGPAEVLRLRPTARSLIRG
jgi:quinol monooxygenase YgiN